jgi:hypothetical protein
MYGILNNANELIAIFAAPLHVHSNRPVFVTDSMSLKRFTSYRGTAQRWEIEASLVPLKEDANRLMVDLVTKGVGTPTRVRMPQNYGVIRQNQVTFPINASGSRGSTQISVGNLPPRGVVAGTFVNFSVGGKVYMTTTDSGGSTLNVFPPLLTNISGQMYYKDDVVGSFYYDTSNVQGMTYSDGILFDPDTIRLVEAL